VFTAKASKGVNGGHLHIHNSTAGRDKWQEFLAGFFPVSASISLRDLTVPGGAAARAMLLADLLFSLPVYLFLRIKFPGSAQNLLAMPRLLSRLHVMKQRIKKGSHVYYSGAYEPESNVYAYYLIARGCQVSCFVSGTPLRRYLRMIYCDRLYLSNAYQMEEREIYRKTILADSVSVMPPFSHRDLDYYSSQSSPAYDVAIYTTGVWKRKEEGIFYDPDVEEKEKTIFRLVDHFITTRNRPLKVVVFCHPVEKRKPADYERARGYYLSQLKHVQAFTFAPAAHSTVKHFGDAAVAVTSISNTLFERLYAGHKTMILRKTGDWFPHSASRLQTISCEGPEDFCLKLESFLDMSADRFFNENGIQEYRSSGVGVKPQPGIPHNS
jgi:hypothetical protein